MTDRDIGAEILNGIREIKAHKAGQIVLKTRELKEPASPQTIRAQLKLSQSAFAGLMGVSLRTVQDWEQGRREPSGPAQTLLLLGLAWLVSALGVFLRDLAQLVGPLVMVCMFLGPVFYPREAMPAAAQQWLCLLYTSRCV